MVPPYPDYRPGGRNLTISTIAKVEYSLDNAVPIQATPADGAFDRSIENFYLDVNGLSSGTHTVSVTATSSYGKSSTTTFTIQVQLGVADLTGKGAWPDHHHFSISHYGSTEILFAEVKVNATLYVHVQFLLSRDIGPILTITSPIETCNVAISPCTMSASFNGLGGTGLSLWDVGKYEAQAQVFYSPFPTGPFKPGATLVSLSFRIVA
jgi:hypothetical protein